MIVSHTGKLIFFHNPKAAGASVHQSLERFHDKSIRGWGIAPDGRQLAHYGIDEFASLYPDIWAQIGSYQIFSAYRDPQQRFLSSFAQYSRMDGEIDIRFATPEANRRFLFSVVEKLAKLGTAEAVMPVYEFTVFRPQWIYGKSESHAAVVASYGLHEIEAMYLAIEARLGSPLNRDKINEREALNLPRPIAAVLQHGGLIRSVAGLPGSKLVKTVLQNSFKASGKNEKLGLSDADRSEITHFVTDFYARDFAWISDIGLKVKHVAIGAD